MHQLLLHGTGLSISFLSMHCQYSSNDMAALTVKGEEQSTATHGDKTIGVTDGVSGWSKHGVDAGEYARQLMSNAEYAAVNGDPNSKLDPRKVLNGAYSKTKVQGSSTVCILTLDQHEVTTLPVEAGDVIVAGTDGCLITYIQGKSKSLLEQRLREAQIHRMLLGQWLDKLTAHQWIEKLLHHLQKVLWMLENQVLEAEKMALPL
ncbi:hypothetical protein SADUNF_Sadunf01G0069000 [Salix dunnii]|uniref:Protein phosphatase n=1 Tax=Salix dunnii TaxID=1413687 RepID=A0A835TJJ2_9ROSI|nr:hypothetical protein SADUNF_Sadunf01G0069000 [Salix dunnii]